MAYGQGTLVETVGTMEISQQVDNGVNQNAPKGTVDTKKPAQDTNNVTEPPNRAPANTPVKPVPAPAEIPMAAPVPAMAADTNVFDVNDFNAFKREIDRIDMDARGEDAQWLGKQEKKEELARAMNTVVVAELRFLRKVAAATNDANAVEAIDLVLKKRQDRLNRLVTKLENEAKEERPQRERKTPKPGGTQQPGQTQTERPARSTNPVQRANSTVNQDQ
jgi:ribosome-associated translation inhibitor RaiA